MTPRVRFAPSPTGNVHIGNIRVAIFNWLFARHHDGQFLLRVEDTDLERSTPEAIQNMLAAMEWLGLNYDEEPVYQTHMRPKHEALANRMMVDGHASRAGDGDPVILHLHAGLFDPSFVTDPRDEAEVNVRKGTLTVGATKFVHSVESKSKGTVYDTPIRFDALDWQSSLRFVDDAGTEHPASSLPLFQEMVQAAASQAEADGTHPEYAGCTVDFKEEFEKAVGSPLVSLRFLRRYVFFDDLVLGRLEKPLDTMRDLVIVRSDGSPVFHLANVVDDIEMDITHILRGNDHVENTYRHLFLYKALNSAVPHYAHFPMIVNDKGKPYSKRDGDAYVGDFRSKGYLPECLFNFLALCGWSTGDDREIMTRDEMVGAFSLERINASAAQFNPEKLVWMNSQYLSHMSAEELLPLIREELEAEGIAAGTVDAAWLEKLIALQQEHMKTVKEFVQASHYFFRDAVELEEKAVNKVLLKKDAAGLVTLREIRTILDDVDDWSETALESAITTFASNTERKMGDVAQPLRVAVTGGTVSRGIWETLALIGRERVLARIDHVLTSVQPAE